MQPRMQTKYQEIHFYALLLNFSHSKRNETLPGRIPILLVRCTSDARAIWRRRRIFNVIDALPDIFNVTAIYSRTIRKLRFAIYFTTYNFREAVLELFAFKIKRNRRYVLRFSETIIRLYYVTLSMCAIWRCRKISNFIDALPDIFNITNIYSKMMRKLQSAINCTTYNFQEAVLELFAFKIKRNKMYVCVLCVSETIV